MGITVRPDTGTPADVTAPAKSGGNYRWVICGLLFASTAINYIDRQTLGILKPTLSRDLHWNETDYANIVSAFQFTYACGYLFGGRLMDRFGVKRGLPFAAFFWSIASAVHGLVRTVFAFTCARFGLGLAEGGNFPAAIRTVSDWFPVKERALATGIFNSASNVGAIICPLTIPWLALHLGWPSAFYITGALGMAWVVAWALIYESPEKHKHVSAAELAYIQEGRTAVSTEFVPWGTLLKLKASWAYLIATLLTSPVWWFYLFWIPGFLATRFHLTTVKSGFYTSIVYIISIVGSVAGGWFSEMLIRRGWSLNGARKLALLIPAACVVPVFAASSVPSIWTAVILVGVAAASHQAWSANLFTFVSDIMPKRAISSVVGIGGFAGGIAAMFTAQATGWVLVTTKSYVPLFCVASTMYLIALLIMHLLVPVIGPKAGLSED
jgi:ACS family hexuronate transporter-like MFS transporter